MASDPVTFELVEGRSAQPVRWRFTRAYMRARTKGALGLAGSAAALSAWVEFGWQAGLGMVLFVAALGWGYTRFMRERTYELDEDGVRVRFDSGRTRFHAWEAFESFQTHSEYAAAASRFDRGTRRVTGHLPAIGDRYGEWLVLSRKSTWGWPLTLPVTAEVDDVAFEHVTCHLPHRPGNVFNALVVTLSLLLVLLVIAGVITATLLFG